MFRRRFNVSVTRLIAIDRALIRGFELRSFALQLGVAPEQLRDDLTSLEHLGQNIRQEILGGSRHFYSYARDQLPLFTKNVRVSSGLGTRFQTEWN